MLNAIKKLRLKAGITQKNLALVAKTSQPTIAMYEAGSKSPSLSTLNKLANSLGFDIHVTFIPKMTREDKRSLAYHYAIVNKLKDRPDQIRKKAKKTLIKLKLKHPHAKDLLGNWSKWLNLPLESLISNILNPNQESREMRHVSPFAGILSPKERTKLLKEFRRNYSL
ncbi:MAG: helix-turn-helix transcriptional regulator [Pseudomonadota bacterium]